MTGMPQGLAAKLYERWLPFEPLGSFEAGERKARRSGREIGEDIGRRRFFAPASSGDLEVEGVERRLDVGLPPPRRRRPRILPR